MPKKNIIWYRGSNRKNPITFDHDEDFDTNERYGCGLYFTNNPETASMYGKVHAYEIPNTGIYSATSKIDILTIRKILYQKSKEDLEMFLSDWHEDYLTKPEKVMRIYLNSLLDYNDTMGEALISVYVDAFNYQRNEFYAAAINAGVNGFITKTDNTSNPKERYLILYNPAIIQKVFDVEQGEQTT